MPAQGPVEEQDRPKRERVVYAGAFVHCSRSAPVELDICEAGLIGVDDGGVIAFVERRGSPTTTTTTDGADVGEWIAQHKPDWSDVKVVRAPKGGFFFPGFIDTHIHASQYPNTGIFGKSTLLDWLHTYTFPLEASFSSLSRARRIYERVVARTLSHGTTTAAYYATVHVEATNLLADICLARGQRALVGRVCMDQMSPDYYRDESVESAVRDTRACIEHARQIDPHGTHVRSIITPRFAPACSRECLAALGVLRAETDAHVQTHISENKNEIALVKELFPEAASYADVYDRADLLAPKTILAHAVHLTEDEKLLVKARGAKVSHCPASNTALTSGCAPIRDLWDRGIDVGLGTDVSGGYSPSVLEMVRQAVLVSRFVAMGAGDRTKLSTEEALYLATRGGAKVVQMEDKVGGFEVGMDWDAQLIGLHEVPEEDDDAGCDTLDLSDNGVDIWGWESWENKVNIWVYNGDDRNTLAVWVKGRLVHTLKSYTDLQSDI